MKTQTKKGILTLIMADMEHDATILGGQPFSGHVTAQVCGRLMAAISALADVAASSEEEITHLKEALAKLQEDGALKYEPEEVEMGCFWGLNPGERPGACALSCVYAAGRKKNRRM